MKISPENEKEYLKLKIGKLTQTMMRYFLKENFITQSEIENLQNAGYSKLKFNANYSLLVKISNLSEIKTKKIVNGFPRYYVKPYINNNEMYLFTNEWKEFQRKDFMEWMKSKVKIK